MKRLFFALAIVLSFSTIVSADNWWQQEPLNYAQKVGQNTADMSFERYSSAVMMGGLNSLSNAIMPNPYNQLAAVPVMGNVMAMLLGNPPVRTVQYLAYMGAKAGLIDRAYAADPGAAGGFSLLAPVQKIWVATRNIAYLITSLTLVVIGFLIIMRKKVDAQTVIGVQQALPGIVITLLLITFSYAIAGLVIDLIYFLIYFSVKLLATNNIFSDNGNAVLEAFRTKSIFTMGIGDLFKIGGTSGEAIGDLFKALFDSVLGSGLSVAVTKVVQAPVGYLIIAGAILMTTFKLFFSLLQAYVWVLVTALVGPLQLMFNAMPGSDAFGKWIRNLLGNAMAFPATAIMLVFAAALMGQTGGDWNINHDVGFGSSSSAWTAPLLFGTGGAATDPVKAVMALIGLGLFMMTPKVVEMTKEYFKSSEDKYGSAIGEATQFGWQQSQALGRQAVAAPLGVMGGLQELRNANPNIGGGIGAAMNPLAAQSQKGWQKAFFLARRALGK